MNHYPQCPAHLNVRHGCWCPELDAAAQEAVEQFRDDVARCLRGLIANSSDNGMLSVNGLDTALVVVEATLRRRPVSHSAKEA